MVNLIFGISLQAHPEQQIIPSATPAPINLPSPLPVVTEFAVTLTVVSSPTPPGLALLEPISEANVRAEPDPEAERFGTIRAGELYTVIGRYFRWYQFQYDQSPTGTGWVFDELVTIRGDESTIIDLSEQALPTSDTTAAAQTSTMEFITRTPGGLLTATAQVGIPLPIEGVNTTPSISLPGDSSSVLPTYTYPPEVALTPPSEAFQTVINQEATPTPVPSPVGFLTTSSIPPILPILLFGGLGILGLLLTTRR